AASQMISRTRCCFRALTSGTGARAAADIAALDDRLIASPKGSTIRQQWPQQSPHVDNGIICHLYSMQWPKLEQCSLTVWVPECVVAGPPKFGNQSAAAAA